MKEDLVRRKLDVYNREIVEMSKTRKKVHFLIGTRWFGVLGPCRYIIRELDSAGYSVFVFGQSDSHYERYDDGLAELVEINMKRSYFTPFHDFADIVKIVYYILKHRPDGIHSFNPKPAILSWASIMFRRQAKLFVGITGLGNTFIKQPRLEKPITRLLRLVCARSSFVFFQNFDDIQMFKDKDIVPEEKTRMFISPGVDLDDFKYFDRSDRFRDSVVVVCMARLIWQKGIKEFVEASRLHSRCGDDKRNIVFRLYGEIDHDHPDKVDQAYIDKAVEDGLIVHIPWTDSVSEALDDGDILFLHSYREGAPRAILEGSASGLPTVASDAIGVKELVIEGKTGFKTDLHDIDSAYDAIVKLVDDRALRLELGMNARELIAQPYSLENASNAQMRMYVDSGYNL